MKNDKHKKINIEVSKTSLLKSLSRIQGIVQKVSTKPFTQNVLITASEEGNCYFSATDLQIGIKEKCKDVKIIEEGTVSLNAKTFFDSVKSLPEGIIKLCEDENFKVKIIGEGNSKFELIGMITDDFPVLNIEEDEEKYNEFDIEKLSFLFDSTSFSISRDDERKNLTGAYFENDRENNAVVVVSTDGFRVSIAKENMGFLKYFNEEGFTIPHKGVTELQKILNENLEEKVVKSCLFNNSLIIRFKNIDLIIRLLNVKFPDYKKIIPNDMSSYIEIKIDKNRLKESLKMVHVISQESHSPAFFNYLNKRLNIYSENADIGKALNTIALIDPVDNEFSFCANCIYMLDILNVIEGDVLLYFNINNKKKPILLKSTKNDNAMYIVMPMSTEEDEE